MRVQEDLLAKEAPPPPTGRRSSLGRARFGLGLVEWLEAASREGRTQSRRPHARQTGAAATHLCFTPRNPSDGCFRKTSHDSAKREQILR